MSKHLLVVFLIAPTIVFAGGCLGQEEFSGGKGHSQGRYDGGIFPGYGCHPAHSGQRFYRAASPKDAASSGSSKNQSPQGTPPPVRPK